MFHSILDPLRASFTFMRGVAIPAPVVKERIASPAAVETMGEEEGKRGSIKLSPDENLYKCEQKNLLSLLSFVTRHDGEKQAVGDADDTSEYP